MITAGIYLAEQSAVRVAEIVERGDLNFIAPRSVVQCFTNCLVLFALRFQLYRQYRRGSLRLRAH